MAQEKWSINILEETQPRVLETPCQKREKYVQIKQGMMQELLTGKARLIKDS